MLPLLAEALKHRKLIHWAVAYLAAGWVFLQLIDLLAGPFHLPDVVLRSATVSVAVGFFAVLVVAWFHGEKGAQRVSPREIGLLSIIFVIAVAAVAFVGGGKPGSASADVDRSTSPAVVELGSIAVLPFLNMSSDAEQEYFSDGLTEELLNVLAQVPELRVASRTSAFAYKGTRIGIDSIARALRVAHVLEGSVRKAGDRVRITAQLIRADNGYHVWSSTYDRMLSDVFAIQEEISRAIVTALAGKLSGGGRSQLVKAETDDPEAYALVMKAVHFAQHATRESYEQAVVLFRQAIARDPAYARAYAELARTYSQQAYQYFGPRAALVQLAKAAAERALALDSTLAQAHFARAEIARLHDLDFIASESQFRRAVELKPGLAAPHSTHGWLLLQLGRTGEALAEAKRAVQLDPVSAGLWSNLGAVYTLAEDYERAVEAYQSALDLESDDPMTLGNLALTYSYMGQDTQAIDAAERGRALAPAGQYNLAVVAYAYGRAGRRREAQQAIAQLERQTEVSPYLLATAYAGLDARERVLSLLEQLVAQKDPYAPDLGVDPTFRPYRNDPRVRRLLAHMGLP